MTAADDTPFARLAANWVYGGALAGLLLLALSPLLTEGWGQAGTLAFLVLPVYMLHQYEEHDADRFRRFVNRVLAGGAEALSLAAVFWINIAGVWGLMAADLWLMRRVAPGWGVFAGWLVLVNGAAHLAQGIALRRGNPGIVTGVLLFLPLGALVLAAFWPVATLAQHLLSLAVVLAVHAAIFRQVRRALAAAGAPR